MLKSSTKDLTRVQDAKKMLVRGSLNEPSKKGRSPIKSMGPRRRAPAGQLHSTERSGAHSLPVRGLRVGGQEVGAAPGAPGPSWPSLGPLVSPPTAWDRRPGKLPAERSRQAWGKSSKMLLSAASDTHRPETSNETSSSGGGGSSGSRNRTSKMAAPSATPPLLQAEGSLGGREFFN